MTNVNYKRIGEIKELESGLVSWIADGVFDGNDGEPVPCEIGYWMDDDGDLIPTHIFVRDCYSECGNHYCAATIRL